ncbi:MAG: M20 family metallopeptidase [Rikenellaceae bacterium]
MDPITFRRHIHSHPELSFEEHATAKFIGAALSEEGISYRTIASTGILAKIEGKGDLRRAVVLRADIDALPIEEKTGVEFASLNSGVMHACGHDMHAAMLFGALCELNRSREFEGTIFGLFQPGEECNPGGASMVLAEEPFEGYDIMAVVGQHVDATLEVGEVGFRAGKFMASGDELRFSVCGVGGHAAMRERLKDPVAAMAELVTSLLALNHPDRVLSIGRIEADGATNVVPSVVKIEGTLRTFDEGERRATKQQIRDKAAELSALHKLDIVVDINDGYPCVVCDEGLTNVAANVAAKSYDVEWLERRATAEDFGYYCTRYPSLFYRLGVGREAGAAHTSTFCPSEGAIRVGIELMSSLALRFLDYEKQEK